MEGFAAFDGGRILKSGGLAFGSLVWAAPLFAQAAPDPLAPLPPSAPQQQSVPAAEQSPAVAPPKQSAPAVSQAPAVAPLAQPPVVATQAKPVVVPKDWRGVF